MTDLNKEALPEKANVYVWRGDYVEVSVDFTDDTGTVPFDLTGYVGQADIVANNNVVASFDCDIDFDDGKAKLVLESPVSAILIPGTYTYDFQLIQSATGRVRTFLYGQVIVRGEVTVGI